jgi:hypothetical protein
VPGIRRFTADQLPFRLVVSLTSADPASTTNNDQRIYQRQTMQKEFHTRCAQVAKPAKNSKVNRISIALFEGGY